MWGFDPEGKQLVDLVEKKATSETFGGKPQDVTAVEKAIPKKV